MTTKRKLQDNCENKKRIKSQEFNFNLICDILYDIETKRDTFDFYK